MRRTYLSSAAFAVSALLVFATSLSGRAAADPTNWPQWGQNAQHQGAVSSISQTPLVQLADIPFDPFVLNPDGTAGPELNFFGGELLVHYQAPIINQNDVYMMFETGTYSPTGDVSTRTWHEKRLHWEGDPAQLVTKWDFATDWKPESLDLTGWEAVFHGALAGDFFYVPGAGGSIFKLDSGTGAQLARIRPFGAIDPNTFVAGPPTVDDSGNVFYNAIRLNADLSTANSWLVRVGSDDSSSMVSYSGVLAAVNPPTTCFGAFGTSRLPWPQGTTPTDSTSPADPNARPATSACGIQRVGINIAPAIGTDGSIYSVTRADSNSALRLHGRAERGSEPEMGYFPEGGPQRRLRRHDSHSDRGQPDPEGPLPAGRDCWR